jgi:hypothetical protein
MRHLMLLGLASVVFNGCSPLPRYARINDIGTPASVSAGYQVVAVDDAAATRAKNKDRTAAPLVIVQAGTHKFSVNSPDAPPQTFTATVEPDKEYRIAMQPDGKPTLEATGR